MESHPLPESAGPDAPAETLRLWGVLSWPIGLGTLLLAGSVALAALTLHSPSLASGNDPAPPIKERAAAVAYVDVPGGVSNLYPIQQGRITELPVEEGATIVKKGTLLLQVDDTMAKVRLEEAKIALDVAKKQLEQAKQLVEQHAKQLDAQRAAIKVMQSKVDAAQSQANKIKRYREQNLRGSEEDVQTAQDLVAQARAGLDAEKAKLAVIEAKNPQTDIDMARLDVKAKEQQRDKAEYGVKECQVLAPYDGFLLRKGVNIGEVLGPNPKAPALVFCPAKPLLIRAEVEQEFANGIEIGETVSIKDDAAVGASCTGKVTSVSPWIAQRRSILPEPKQYNDVRTLEVVIEPILDPKTKKVMTDKDSTKPMVLRIGQRVRVMLGERPTGDSGK